MKGRVCDICGSFMNYGERNKIKFKTRVIPFGALMWSTPKCLDVCNQCTRKIFEYCIEPRESVAVELDVKPKEV